jgi:hypothetical protein
MVTGKQMCQWLTEEFDGGIMESDSQNLFIIYV